MDQSLNNVPSNPSDREEKDVSLPVDPSMLWYKVNVFASGCDDEEDVDYVRDMFVSISCLNNEEGDDVTYLGEMVCKLYLTGAFSADYTKSPLSIIDNDSGDALACVEACLDSGCEPIEDMEGVLYIESINLDEPYRNRGLESYIMQHAQSIVWRLMGVRPDMACMILNKHEVPWALAVQDACVISRGHQKPVWFM